MAWSKCSAALHRRLFHATASRSALTRVRQFRAGTLVSNSHSRPGAHQRPVTIMDVDGPSSSPPLRHTSLPPSSAPQGSSNGHSTPRRPRPVADALAFGDEDADDIPQDEAAPRRRRAPGGRQALTQDVPLVKDAVGESVRESFENFLKTCVCLLSYLVLLTRAFQIHGRYLPSNDTCFGWWCSSCSRRGAHLH